jgi:calcineurin-like phosphoesterase
MLGDIVGETGIAALEQDLPALIAARKADLVVANGENAAGGFGLTQATAKRIFAAGVDVITSGNHIWEKRDFWDYMNTCDHILRPANYPDPSAAPLAGHGSIRIAKNGIDFLVINLQGRQFLYNIDCPFRAFDRIYEGEDSPSLQPCGLTLPPLLGAPPPNPHAPQSLLRKLEGQAPLAPATPSPIVLVDFHAESTAEKEALGFYLDSRASAVVGTHTHTQTADEKILPQGTAYITDLGMTGVQGGVIGMDKKICITRALTNITYKMQCASGPAYIQGIHLTIARATRKTLKIERL